MDHPIVSKRYLESAKLEKVQMCPGLVRQTLTFGKDVMLCLFTWEKGAVLPEHSHPNEQAGYVLSGAVEFVISGEKYILRSGSSYIVRTNEVHSGVALEPSQVLDSFSPVRDEYK